MICSCDNNLVDEEQMTYRYDNHHYLPDGKQVCYTSVKNLVDGNLVNRSDVLLQIFWLMWNR